MYPSDVQKHKEPHFHGRIKMNLGGGSSWMRSKAKRKGYKTWKN